MMRLCCILHEMLGSGNSSKLRNSPSIMFFCCLFFSISAQCEIFVDNIMFASPHFTFFSLDWWNPFRNLINPPLFFSSSSSFFPLPPLSLCIFLKVLGYMMFASQACISQELDSSQTK